MKRIAAVALLLALGVSGYPQKISISLFNETDLQNVMVSPVTGHYHLVMGAQVYVLAPNQIVFLSRVGDSVSVRDMASDLGRWQRVSLIGQSADNTLRVSPLTPSAPARVYDENLMVYVDFNRIMAINLVDLEKYVAGVVEAEAGPNAQIQFYKAQALLARTYALRHMERHSGEGFNLCDGVHCQVYKGKSVQNPTILQAAMATQGLVVVDTAGQLITGAFHANCGGQTAHSEHVWLAPKYYLASVTDPYCRGLPSSQWEVRIPLDSWRAFLQSKGVDAANLPPASFVFQSRVREYFYPIGGKRIPKVDIRAHFNLRSAFFNVEVVSGHVRLRGRGFGHGVGLCQDGGMQMARRGRPYDVILRHYFGRVDILPYTEYLRLNHAIPGEAPPPQ